MPSPDHAQGAGAQVVVVPPPEPRRTLAIAREITVTELARRMSLTREEVVTTLVTNGFFSITPKST
jgi:hypothetical protein